jgi:hypothetical protein
MESSSINVFEFRFEASECYAQPQAPKPGGSSAATIPSFAGPAQKVSAVRKDIFIRQPSRRGQNPAITGPAPEREEDRRVPQPLIRIKATMLTTPAVCCLSGIKAA